MDTRALRIGDDLWEIPEKLSLLFMWHEHRGAEEAKTDMRSAMGAQQETIEQP